MKTFTFKPREKKINPLWKWKTMSHYFGKHPKLHNETIKNNQAYVELSKILNHCNDYTIVTAQFISWAFIAVTICEAGMLLAVMAHVVKCDNVFRAWSLRWKYSCFDAHLLRDPAVWNNVVFLKEMHCYCHNKCLSSACEAGMAEVTFSPQSSVILYLFEIKDYGRWVYHY